MVWVVGVYFFFCSAVAHLPRQFCIYIWFLTFHHTQTHTNHHNWFGAFVVRFIFVRVSVFQHNIANFAHFWFTNQDKRIIEIFIPFVVVVVVVGLPACRMICDTVEILRLAVYVWCACAGSILIKCAYPMIFVENCLYSYVSLDMHQMAQWV